MLRYSLSALAGVCALQLFTALPSPGIIMAFVVLAIVCAIHRCSRPLSVFVCGIVVIWFAATQQLTDRLDPILAAKTLTITAVVVDFPSFKGDSIRLLV